MIVEERLTTYINSLDTGHTPALEALAEDAQQHHVPIIRREMESFMKLLLSMNNSRNILEIGAGICYSTIFMAMNSEESHITTIENYAERIRYARENIVKAGMEERIELIEDDAAKVLPTLQGPYDLIFLDAAKGQYITFLPEILRLLRKGGILLADNVLQDGEIVRSRYATPRRQRTIHDRMREFIWEVKHTEELDTSVITIGDGVTLSIRR